MLRIIVSNSREEIVNRFSLFIFIVSNIFSDRISL